MAIQDSDLFLVNRAGASYQVRADELKAKMADSDLMLVNRESGGNYASYKGTKSQVLDGGLIATDHLLVNRGAASYYCTGAEFEEYFGAGSALALMHGLRFDSARKTNLSRYFEASGKTATISFWMKPTNVNTYQHIYTSEWGDPNAWACWLEGGKFEVNESFGTVISIPNIQTNTWQHIVISQNNSDVNVYLNGELKGSSSSYTNAPFSHDKFHTISGYNGTTAFSDAYLSDLYVVDGQALDPTAFGAEFEGKWGPLDSSVIKESVYSVVTDEIVGVSPDGKTITLKTDKDLSKLKPGDKIEQSGTQASVDRLSIVGTTLNVELRAVYLNGTRLTDGAATYTDGIFAGTIYDGGPFRSSTTADNRIEARTIGWDIGQFFDLSQISSLEYEMASGSNSDHTYTVKSGDTVVDTITVGSRKRYDMMPYLKVLVGATAIVDSVDVGAKTVTTSSIYGNWGPANSGHYALGPNLWGANGFYLPFNPATAGFNYSSNCEHNRRGRHKPAGIKCI